MEKFSALLGLCEGNTSLNSRFSFTVYPKKYAHGFCFTVLCCGYKLTDFPISIRLTSLALWQSNDCPSASKATLMYMDKCFMWTHYERLHNHNKAKHNKTVCIFLGIYCIRRPVIWCMIWYFLKIVGTRCWTNIWIAGYLRRYDAHVTSLQWLAFISSETDIKMNVVCFSDTL